MPRAPAAKYSGGAAHTGIDWGQILSRLALAAAALESVAKPDAARKAEILKARALVLAREPLQALPSGYNLEIVEFALAYERYALASAFVREVHPLRDITVLPGTPAFLAGIVNVRGQIVSVVDLKRLFDLPPRGLTDLNKVIILDDGKMVFGLLVDAVVGVYRLLLEDIQPAVPTLTGVRAQFVQGVTAQRMIVLDAAKLLADPTMVCTD